jgi:starch-binding outer membrane protein, SusD/RagB family
MNKLFKIGFGLALVASLTVGCDDLLEVDSDRVVFENENQLNSPNDSIHSMFGILSKLSKLANRYVLAGELRGELMDITANADEDLRAIYNFTATADNPYVNILDYYAVINGCNYLIANIDTSLIVDAEKALMKHMAAAKAVRAWTYMQIALNFGKAKYYTNPILTIKDANAAYPEYDINQLAPLLIADLEPMRNVPLPGSVSLGSEISTYRSYFPVKFVLGDLYLWTGQYENAALAYHDLMLNSSLYVSKEYNSYWELSSNAFTVRNLHWDVIFTLNEYEQISLFAGATDLGEGNMLDSITYYDYKIAPSQTAIDNWDRQIYYHNASVTNEGDLRGEIASYRDQNFYYKEVNIPDAVTGPWIAKYRNLSVKTTKAVLVYRTGLLYLRYAEAVNRAGKPNLAFATLKNGLNSSTLANTSIVPTWEVTESRPEYMNFDKVDANNSTYTNFNATGIHARGCGNVHLTSAYSIPALANLQDSITYVEDKIMEELALETAFEGNRFHDLMRVALRRDNPSYLAEKVGPRGVDLTNKDNWYFPLK